MELRPTPELLVVGFVESGLGVAAVPRLSMPRKGHPLLVSVPIVDPEVMRTVGLIKRRGRSLSPAAEHLYEMLRTVAQKQTAARKSSARPPGTGVTVEANPTRGERRRSRRTADAQ